MTTGDAYPPSPWELRGQLHASVFLVPLAAFPPGELDLPPGWSLVRVPDSRSVGKVVVGAAWVVYEPGGDMAYRELMATVLIRRGLRLAPHIVRIWVDSVASRDGGRAHWAIPKELAEFTVDAPSRREALFRAFEPQDPDGPEAIESHPRGPAPVAAARVRRGLRFPGHVPLNFYVVQRRDGAALVSPVRVRASLTLTRARWIAEPFGPLGFLAERRPTITVGLRDFRMIFGGLPTAKRDEPVVNAR